MFLAISLLVAVIVAVIDTGINAAHVHFADTPIYTYDTTYGYNTYGMADTCNHGTSVAGLIVNQNPEVELLIIQATAYCGADFGTIIDGINYAVDFGARVINISMAAHYHWPEFETTISKARAAGVLVVVAAGNEGDDTTPVYPAWYADAMTVAAHDLRVSSYGQNVDLAASGWYVLSPWGNKDMYLYTAGTSMAAPVVAGLASAIWSAQPDLALEEMEAILYASLMDMHEPGWDERTGWGRADKRLLDAALGKHALFLPRLKTGTIFGATLPPPLVVLDTVEIAESLR